MTMTNIPEAEVVREELAPYIPFLFTALETGLERARDFFAEGCPFDPYLASHLARYEAKRYLMNSGIICAEIANTGLFITVGQYPIRILKADEGEVPHPGPSRQRRAFYQQIQLQLPFPDVTAQINGPNLIIVWDATSSYTLLGMILACPQTGGVSRGSVSCYWAIPLPHPATTSQVPTHMAASSQGVVDDLPEIQIIQSPAETTGNNDDE